MKTSDLIQEAFMATGLHIAASNDGKENQEDLPSPDSLIIELDGRDPLDNDQEVSEAVDNPIALVDSIKAQIKEIQDGYLENQVPVDVQRRLDMLQQKLRSLEAFDSASESLEDDDPYSNTTVEDDVIAALMPEELPVVDRNPLQNDVVEGRKTTAQRILESAVVRKEHEERDRPEADITNGEAENAVQDLQLPPIKVDDRENHDLATYLESFDAGPTIDVNWVISTLESAGLEYDEVKKTDDDEITVFLKSDAMGSRWKRIQALYLQTLEEAGWDEDSSDVEIEIE